MRRSLYLSVLLQQSPEWIRSSMSNPTSGMTKTHIALHAIALRRLTPPQLPVDVWHETAYGHRCRFSRAVRVYSGFL